MAIIDLASLCSPIHNFKRGLIFGHSANSSNNDHLSNVDSRNNKNPLSIINHNNLSKLNSSFETSNNEIINLDLRSNVNVIFDAHKKEIKNSNEEKRNNELVNLSEQKSLMQFTQSINNYNLKYSCENPFLCIQSNTVAIFDLDDTLIPTDWIRDTYSKIRQNSSLNHLFSNLNTNVYQYIRMQIDQQVNYQLLPNIIRIITSAKRQFLDVAIVTNARSIGWLKVIEAMFPELSTALLELGIPIIRTNPIGIEPEIEDGERYFNYWMMAKKLEFEKIINKWSNNLENNKLDLISIGDNDFEECAAIHLAVVDRIVRYSKIIRCTSGLSPKSFLSQLQAISNAIEIEKKRTSPHPWVNYTNTVSTRIIESNQSFGEGYIYEDSTEDE